MFSSPFTSSPCRVCLSTKNGTKVLMSSDNGWLDKFQYCFGLQIKLQDHGRVLCEECGDNIEKFVKFKAKCLKSDEVWKTYILEPEVRIEHIQLDTINEDSPAYHWEADNKKYQKTAEETDNRNIGACAIFKNYETRGNSFELQKSDTFFIESETSVKNNFDEEKNDQIEIINSAQSEDCYLPQKVDRKNLKHSFKKTNTVRTKSKTQLKRKSYRKIINEKATKRNSIGICQNVPILADKITNKNHSMTNDDVDNQSTDFIYTENSLKIPHCMCGQKFGNIRSNDIHKKKCQINKWYNKQMYAWQNCGLCKFSTESLNDLWKHFDEHFTRNDLECKLCKYTGRDFSEMAYHRFSHLGSTSTLRLYCVVCRQFFRNYRALQFHFRKTHLNKTGALCRFCDIELKTMNGWRRHETRSHADILFGKRPLFYCDCCSLKFSCRNTLTAHLRSLEGAFKCVCEKCGQVFARKNNLKSHIRNVHTENKMVKCPECDKIMKDNSLKQHLNFTHGEKRLSCEVCSKKFPNNLNLKYHMLSHTNARPFKCDICGVSYKTASCMKMHKMRAHTAERPYVCASCAKGFCTKTQLDVHIAVHSKEKKQFNCDDCDRSFSYKSTLRAHREKVHYK